MKLSAFTLVTFFGAAALVGTACSESSSTPSPVTTKVEADTYSQTVENVEVVEQPPKDQTQEPATKDVSPTVAINVPIAETKPVKPVVSASSVKVVQVTPPPTPVEAPPVLVEKELKAPSLQPEPIVENIVTPEIKTPVEQPVMTSTPETTSTPEIKITDVKADTPVSIPTKHLIEIKRSKFSIKTLDVRVGDEVTWTNLDIVPHTATALDKTWDSGELKRGESFTLVITDEMSLAYFCLYHRQMKAEFIISDNS